MRGLLNLSVDRIKSIDAFRIVLLKEFSLFSFPNKRVLTILSSFSVKIFYRNNFVEEGLSLKMEVWAMEKKMFCCFSTTAAAAHRVY